MKSCFYRPSNFKGFISEEIIAEIDAEVHQICEQSIISLEEAVEYVSDLMSKAKVLPYKPQMAFWGLDDPNNMPADARVYYFYVPTYYLTAAIITLSIQFPQLLEQDTAFSSGLQKALLACTGRNFKGHGYDSFDGLLDTMRIFALSPVSLFLERYPDMCPEFAALWKEYDCAFRDDLATGKAACIPDAWSGTKDYTLPISEIVTLIDNTSQRFKIANSYSLS